MSARCKKRRRTYCDSDDDHDGDAVAPPYNHTNATQSDDPMGNTDVDSTFDPTRRSAAAVQFPVQDPQSSSSYTNSLGMGGLETSPTTPEQHRPVMGNMVIGGNTYPRNNDPFRRLDYPVSTPFLKAQEKNFQSFTGASRNLKGSFCFKPAPEATVSAPMHSHPPSSVGFVVDSFQPSTRVRVKLPDGTAITGNFNYHHTIADIRSFIDASMPGEWKPYQLLICSCFPARVLNDHNQTIQQAQLFNSVVHVGF